MILEKGIGIVEWSGEEKSSNDDDRLRVETREMLEEILVDGIGTVGRPKLEYFFLHMMKDMRSEISGMG